MITVSTALQVLRAFPMRSQASKIQEVKIQPNTVAVQCEVHLILDGSNKEPGVPTLFETWVYVHSYVLC
jgi:hypothetical protein